MASYAGIQQECGIPAFFHFGGILAVHSCFAAGFREGTRLGLSGEHDCKSCHGYPMERERAMRKKPEKNHLEGEKGGKHSLSK